MNKAVPSQGKESLLLTGGNISKTRVSTGKLDANPGFVFTINKENKALKAIPVQKSGLFFQDEVRDIKTIRVGEEFYYIYAFNNEAIKVFKIR